MSDYSMCCMITALRADPAATCDMDGQRQALLPLLAELFIDQIEPRDVLAYLTADEAEAGRLIQRDLRNVLWQIAEREPRIVPRTDAELRERFDSESA